MKIHTIESELARRRVRWSKTMVANSEDNVMNRAALSGKMDMGEEGKTRITPWMEQLLMDLTTLTNRGRYDLDVTK
jgi:hypothetical protein